MSYEWNADEQRFEAAPWGEPSDPHRRRYCARSKLYEPASEGFRERVASELGGRYTDRQLSRFVAILEEHGIASEDGVRSASLEEMRGWWMVGAKTLDMMAELGAVDDRKPKPLTRVERMGLLEQVVSEMYVHMLANGLDDAKGMFADDMRKLGLLDEEDE